MGDGAGRGTGQRFLPWVLLAALVGLVIRVAYALAHADDRLGGDALFYQLQAKAFAEGHGIIQGGFFYFDGRLQDSAEHPPLFTIFLAIPHLLGLETPLQLRLWCVPLGVATVILMAYAARELAGDRAGIIAAVGAAVYPLFWMTDGLVMSEALTTPTVALSVWLGARLYRAPSLGRAAAFGAAAAVATLVRAELALLVPIVLLPLLWRATAPRGWFRWKLVGVGGVVALLVVAPWLVRNLTTFEHPVLLSNGWDLAVQGANCETTYYDENVGGIDMRCGADLAETADQTVQFQEARRQGLEYAREHAGRIPFVVFARVGRTFGFFNVRQQAAWDAYFEQRERAITYAGLLAWWVLVPLGVYGGVVLHRRRTSLVPVLAPVITVLVASATTFGNTRLRIPADVSVIIAAAVGISALLSRPRAADPAPAVTGSPPRE
jgi:4-amino-4-deoxy-L-arabinose transferase-like glycosyltransferase